MEHTKQIRHSKPIVGIIGGHLKNTNPDAILLAKKMGIELAKAGLAIATGGEDGIMESVCIGAKEAGGTTIAITKSNRKSHANNYIDYVIPTSLDLAFMNVLAWSSDVVVAFDGKFGTMCEIGLLLDIGRPLVLLGKHELIKTDKIEVDNFIHLKEYSDENISKAIDFVVNSINKKDAILE